MARTVHVHSLGCARNDVDSEELAGRLADAGFALVSEPADAETVVVNTCGFVEQAKKDSVDTLLAAADLKGSGTTRAVVAVGCLAERYGATLAAALPEADAVLGFDDYPDIASRLRSVLAGTPPEPHVPRDRRRLLPVAPTERAASARSRHLADLPDGVAPASGPRPPRHRLDGGPVSAVKLASGCDRRCSFCAIPSFRGAFWSRPPDEVLDEARWLAEQGVREVLLVSENSTSYGKDLGDRTLLERLLADLAAVDGLVRVRVSYLQPAEVRQSLVEAIAATPGVAPYFDLSFQHASEPVLRRMRRYGSAEHFLALLDQVRSHAPAAGVRSNVIVGFPGETEGDLQVLEDFLAAAQLDAVGVFGYSDEEGTEAAGFADQLHPDEVAERVERVASLADELMDQRAQDRIGEPVDVLVEAVEPGPGGRVTGRAAHQAPEVDGDVRLVGVAALPRVGDVVAGTVVAGGPAGCLTARVGREGSGRAPTVTP